MADYTIELRTIIEECPGIDIGLSDYPIFNEDYREVLNQKIIDHYWFYEIGHETVDMFARQMRTKMREIMPYYNKMYEVDLIKINPLYTVDMTTDNTSTAKATTSNTSKLSGNINESHEEKGVTSSTADSKSRAVNSETPQVRLSGDEDYATSAADSVSGSNTKGDTDTKGSSASSNTSQSDDSGTALNDMTGTNKTQGYSGVAGDIITAWRNSVINVDLLVINELSSLFMQLWNSNDEYNERYYGYGWY